MNFYVNQFFGNNRTLKKIKKIMKLMVFLSTFLALNISATVYSQDIKLTLDVRQASIKEILHQIESKTEFRFIYENEKVDLDKKISLRATEKTVEDILDQIFKGANINYVVTANNLILIDPWKDEKNIDAIARKAQGIAITGTVLDETGQPMPGVNVMVKGTITGVITDANGKYTLNVPTREAMLAFSFIGYAKQEIAVGDQREINITMSEDTQQLEEVVVVGYGTQRKGYLTGSVSDIKAEKLTVTPIANVTHALAGQLPGLVSKYTGGQPGSDAASLSIRGFGGALVIVDGVESSFSDLDPSQIESISILKDGAASIYGARAGNGVILVTSKRGIDQKPTITVNSSYSLQGVTRMVKPASSGQWAQMEREVHLNSGQPEASVPWLQEDVDKFFAGNDPAYPNADWWDFIFRDFAPLQNHNLSIRGGSDRIKYYGFVGYTDQETMIKEKGGSFQRYNIQSNIDAKVTQNLTLSVDLSLIYENHFFSPRGMSGASYYFWNDVYLSRPWLPASFPDPTKLAYGGFDVGSAYAMSNIDIAGYSQTKNRNIRGGIFLEYDFSKFVKGLKAKAYINYRDIEGYGKNFQQPFTTYRYNPTTEQYTAATSYPTSAILSESMSRSSVLTQQYSVSYENTFMENHRLSAFILFESMNILGNWFNASRRDFMTVAIDQMFAGSTDGMTNGGSANEMGRTSYVGKLNYIYRDRYLLETIIRADASSRFDTDYRWGYFPSVSVGWIMSQESFMGNISFLEHLKLRASYGQSGNDGVANFAYLAGYAVSGIDSYIFGSTPVKGLYATGLANPLLSWEKMTIYNAGVDFTFTDRKIYGTAEYFYRDRSGIPTSRHTSLPSTFGASLPVENLNRISDRGFELSLGTVQKAGRLMLDVSGNISWSRSKYKYYEEPDFENVEPDQKRISKRTGKWTDVVFGYKSDQLFTSQEQIDALGYEYSALGGGNSTLRPGDVKLLDTNNDGVLDWRDQQEIGSSTSPHWMYGLNVVLKYRNFDLSALFQGAFGYTTYVNFGTFFKTDKMYELRWTEANNDANAVVPRLGGSPSNDWASDYYYKRTSYVRLKNASIGYELLKSLLSKVGIAKLRLYLAGTNLFTLSNLNKYGIDPEAPSVYQYYPQQRTYSIGLNLSF